MINACISVGATIAGLVGLAALLTVGLGAVATLFVFWLIGLGTTLALAASVDHSTSVAVAHDTPVAGRSPRP